jgi:hypothetical protein
MKKNFKIFDVILFDGNYSLLNLRILEFSDIVDYFIVVPTSEESKIKIENKNDDKIVIFDVFQNLIKLREDLKEFLTKNYSTFDDLIFLSKENELPDFRNLEEIVIESKIKIVSLEHKTLCWNIDFYDKKNSLGAIAFTFSKFLTNQNCLQILDKNSSEINKYNLEKFECGWKFINFHESTTDEIYVRETLLPSIIYNPTTTYKLEKRNNNFELPKNVGILAYHKIGREYMKQHLFLVESDKDVNLNEIRKIYDTVSIIEFSNNSNEMIAENIGESVFKSILHLPSNVLYGEKPLKDFHEDYKKNEIKKIIETIFPQDQDMIRIIYKGFDDSLGLWGTLKNQTFSQIINPS